MGLIILVVKMIMVYHGIKLKKAKSLGLTTDELSTLMNSAYIYLPYIKSAKKEIDEKSLTITIEGGIIWWQLKIDPDGKAIPNIEIVADAAGGHNGIISNEDIETIITELVHGITTRKGFFVLTGEVGVGKTTISRKILQLLTEAEIKRLRTTCRELSTGKGTWISSDSPWPRLCTSCKNQPLWPCTRTRPWRTCSRVS
jgi:hypothetical protein